MKLCYDMDEHKGVQRALFWNRVSTIMLGIVMAGLLHFIWLLTYPYKVVEVYNLPFPILNENKTVALGEPIVFEMHYQKFMDVEGVSIKHIICDNGRVITYAPVNTALPKGEGRIVSRNTTLPEDIQPNQYCTLHLNVAFQVNFLRDIHQENQTEPFYVIK